MKNKLFSTLKKRANNLVTNKIHKEDVLQLCSRILQSPTRLFVVIALLSGSVMAFAMPLFMVPDETVHFYRAYQVGELRFSSPTINGETGGYVPLVPGGSRSAEGRYVAPIPRDQYFNSLPNPSERFIPFPSSALYSPVPYLPQAVGIDVGRLLHDSLGAMALFGRLFNLCAFVLLVALAIRLAPVGKWVYAVAGLFPVAIQEAASLATDAMTIGLCFVTIALIHRLFMQATRITRKQIIWLAVLAAGLGLTKQTNIVVLFPLLFLPVRLFATQWRKFAIVMGLLGVSLVAVVGWYGVVKLSNYNLDYSTTLGIEKIDQVGQLQYMASHPVEFTKTLLRTYVYEGQYGIQLADFYWVSMYGFFSVFAYKLPIPLIALGYALLLFAFLHSARDRVEKSVVTSVGPGYAAVGLSTYVLAAIAIACALYMVWTPIGRPQVAGIQGRYFIPLLPLLILPMAYISRWFHLETFNKRTMGLLVTVISVLNLTAMIALTIHYF